MMGRLTCWTSLAVLAVFLCHMQMSAACSCQYQHPQTKFCQSHFVALVNVEEFATVDKPYTVAYKVNVSQILKVTPAAQVALEKKPVWIRTASQSSLCGVLAPKPGETWIFGGHMYDNHLHLSYCGLAMRWSDVSPLQQGKFRDVYRTGCDCQITDSYLDATPNRTCFLRFSYEERACQERYGTCMLDSTRCSWMPSVDYNQCIMKHRLASQH